MRILWILSGVLLFAGCATQVKPISISQQEPEFFIQFEKGKSKVNNKFILRERVESVVHNTNSRPMILMQSFADTVDGYSLAISRLDALKKSLDFDAEFVLFVKRAERTELADLVSISIHPESTQLDERIYSQNYYSEIHGADGVFKEDAKRLLLARPITKKIIPVGETVLEQIDYILGDLGWSMTNVDCESPEDIKRIQDIDVVTLSNEATKTEVMRLLSGLVSEVTPTCDFYFSEVKKNVELKRI